MAAQRGIGQRSQVMDRWDKTRSVFVAVSRPAGYLKRNNVSVVAIVTGGAGSIGRATDDGSRKTDSPSYWPMSTRRGDDRGMRFRAPRRPLGGEHRRTLPLCADVGTLQAVVNTHGILHETRWGRFDEDEIASIIAINLTGTARMAHAAGVHLAETAR